ncbi:MAG: hypothetical protein AAF416_07410 [Pseudomonadota bacterium]
MILGVGLALGTPPAGPNVFLIRGFSPETPMDTILRGVLPFCLGEVVHSGVPLPNPAICLLLPARMRS